MLVERVEGFASPAQWLRAYSEINQFEEQLVDRRHRRRQILAHQPGGTASPLSGTPPAVVQAMEADRRGLAEPQEMERVPRGRQRDVCANEHANGAVDAGGSQRQILRAAQGHQVLIDRLKMALRE